MRTLIASLLIAGAGCTAPNLDALSSGGDLAAAAAPLDLAPPLDLAAAHVDAMSPDDQAPPPLDLAAPRDLALTSTALCRARGNGGGCGTGGFVFDAGCVCNDGTFCGNCDCSLLQGMPACVGGHCGGCVNCVCGR